MEFGTSLWPFSLIDYKLLHICTTQVNTGQFGNEYRGNDLKVEQAWLQGVSGCNVTVTVVDDGRSTLKCVRKSK